MIASLLFKDFKDNFWVWHVPARRCKDPIHMLRQEDHPKIRASEKQTVLHQNFKQ